MTVSSCPSIFTRKKTSSSHWVTGPWSAMHAKSTLISHIESWPFPLFLMSPLPTWWPFVPLCLTMTYNVCSAHQALTHAWQQQQLMLYQQLTFVVIPVLIHQNFEQTTPLINRIPDLTNIRLAAPALRNERPLSIVFFKWRVAVSTTIYRLNSAAFFSLQPMRHDQYT